MTPAQVLAKEAAKAKREALEAAMALQIRAAGLGDGMVREHRPFDDRQWRVDFCWPSQFVCLEVEGGVFTGGRHTRGAGFTADVEKYNRLAIAGWVVLRATAEHIRTGQALEWLRRCVR